jgi:hypothetical protein
MNTITQKLCTTLLLSSLATCQPSYAIAPNYQPLNSHSFNYVDVVAVNGNNKTLSKSHSVTPQRHCGFFAPSICLASQARYKHGVSAAASPLRLQSVYDGTTRPNKPMANKSGGSMRPRVNPVTHLASQAKSVNTQKLIGVAHHG